MKPTYCVLFSPAGLPNIETRWIISLNTHVVKFQGKWYGIAQYRYHNRKAAVENCRLMNLNRIAKENQK